MHGTAEFVPGLEGVSFTERGVLVLPHASAEARQKYLFVIESNHAFSVFFGDGRFFHRAEIVADTALVFHDCAPDHYNGRYRFPDMNHWSLSWRITGPRKDRVISTMFSRSV